jgi:hypothetical protein
MSVSNDPFAVADSAGERSDHIYGQVQCSASFVVLQKGVGKSAFDDHSHDLKDRRTEVSILVNPIDETGLTWFVQRDIIAESREWSGIVWPSLRNLGLQSARDLDGKYAKVKMVKSGRKWTDKDREEREGTTVKFLALYPDQAACVTAYQAEAGVTADDDPAAAVDMSPQQPNGNGNMERETARQFLAVLVKQAAGDKAALTKAIAGLPMVAKYFTVDSPEVVALMAAG